MADSFSYLLIPGEYLRVDTYGVNCPSIRLNERTISNVQCTTSVQIENEANINALFASLLCTL